ncbi:MAG: hypothetical protein CVU00_10035 [Bacteroidetes bacterium HGW-Bacteroidetes-17]|nr:MAG: hypothetical protein CVU00_10035 [Bacteroidetes bacterium HGW-Bacteroidetes-17]
MTLLFIVTICRFFLFVRLIKFYGVKVFRIQGPKQGATYRFNQRLSSSFFDQKPVKKGRVLRKITGLGCSADIWTASCRYRIHLAVIQGYMTANASL